MADNLTLTYRVSVRPVVLESVEISVEVPKSSSPQERVEMIEKAIKEKLALVTVQMVSTGFELLSIN